MGLFKNLKNYSLLKKHIDLIETKMSDVISNIQIYQIDDSAKTWAQTNVYCSFGCLSSLMFPALDEIPKESYEDLFGEFTQIERTDPIKVYNQIKLLLMFNMIMYLSDCQNGIILKDPKVTREIFNATMYDLFEFNENDKQYYECLCEEFLGRIEFKLLRLIREEMLDRGFGITADKNLPKIIFFTQILNSSYKRAFISWV